MEEHDHVELRQTSAGTSSSNTSEKVFEKGSPQIIERVTAQEDVSLESFAHLDIREINRKIDIRIIPMITILYLLSFLDRGSIGNAKIQGLVKDLRLTDTEYNLCLTVFFFTYAAFEVPSNIMLKKLQPSIWLPTIMVGWGTVMTLMGLVQGFHGLLIARLFLGMTEAGLAPGIIFYLTCWYPRYEVQARNAMFFSAAAVAGAFSGLLAYGISFMDGVGLAMDVRSKSFPTNSELELTRYSSFILEGLATVVIAAGAYFILYDFPETASFLTPEERAFVAYRLKYDNQDDSTDVNMRIPQTESRDKKFIKEAFADWQVYLAILSNWGLVIPLYGVSLSMPTIIKEMGYKSTTAQLMTVPVYCTAAIITISVAFAADRLRLRSPFLIVCYFVELLGFALCVTGGGASRTYAGLFLVACGTYPATPCCLTIATNNLSGSFKRAVGIAIVISASALGGAMACNFYRKRDAPDFILGHAINIGFVCLGLGATALWIWNYQRINKKRAARLAAGEHLMFTPEELSFQGDRAITFKYTL